MFNLHTRRKDSGTPACTLQRDAYNRCIRDAAAKPVKDVLDQTGTMLCGLDEQTVTAHRAQFGTNKVTHQKKQSLAQRVAGAFINPFTAILFFLALVSAVTDMLFPTLSLFGISIAVGLTPEMLPMIVTTCLAKGAVSMSRQKTIVKNLNSIQNFGAIDILCTDKTGTLTQDQVVLEYHMDVNGRDDLRVLRHAYLNSYFQTGYKT